MEVAYQERITRAETSINGDTRKKGVVRLLQSIAASLRSADTKEICNSVGAIVVNGGFEWSSAVAAMQGVSRRYRAHEEMRYLVLAATSALDSTSRRQTS